jgi:hypothetical protein
MVVKLAVNGDRILPMRSAIALTVSEYRVFCWSGFNGVNSATVSPSTSCSVPITTPAGPESETCACVTVAMVTGSENRTRTVVLSGTPIADACGVRLATDGDASSSAMSPSATMPAA